MKTNITTALLLALAALALPRSGLAAELVYAKDGSGVYGYNDTRILPWCNYRVHDPDRPAPIRIDPGPAPAPAPVPADAIVLFNGKNLTNWSASDWKVVDGCIEANNGNLSTLQSFGSFQLHIEWMTPANYQGPWYNRGNNGVLLHGLYEIQIFESYNEKIYPDGQAAAIYGQTPPLVNVCRKPGEWQSFDAIFTAPKFTGDKLLQAARLTLLHNGVVVHLNQQIYGETGHRVLPSYSKRAVAGPIALYGHQCPVWFRNVWIRPM